jgi:hypothetical protein
MCDINITIYCWMAECHFSGRYHAQSVRRDQFYSRDWSGEATCVMLGCIARMYACMGACMYAAKHIICDGTYVLHSAIIGM